ncbi:unnamed protein product [Urochloa decumbens]|uniref:Morc S5 domain-containing protein n=1 Tax=Urochloa decumbens TaxID=240449 RepID=A0ABC8WGB0_9POAL
MSARDLQSPELGRSANSISRIDTELGANDDKKLVRPLQQAHQCGVEKKIRPMDPEEVSVSIRQRSQTDTCQASNHLGKCERDAQTCRDLKPVDQTLSKLNAITAAESTSQAARLSSQVVGTGGTNETIQAQDLIYRERVCNKFQDGNETSHRWILGAIAELLDNAVDEVPRGATKVLIDCVVNPHNGSPSLLVQDNGGGMDPISLWKCMTAAAPNRKPPDSIGRNGIGFKAAISCLGVGAIIFTRHVHTCIPSQSIGLHFISGEETDQKPIVIPMVNYKYNPVTAEIIRCERKPRRFCINMAMLLRLSPYNSEEELLQNFNDIGPHGTKIIVFNLSRNTKGDLDLDFDTDRKDIRISAATMHAENKAVGDQSHLVYKYRTSLRAYVSILYIGLPEHFRIILRGEEVKRRNLMTELKHSQHIRYRHRGTEREDEVVLGFLDDAPYIDADRFCFYYKQRLILPFVPAYGFLDRNRSIVGVLQSNHLNPARNKQDFQWSSEFEALLKILKKMGAEFWKHLKGKELKDAASQLSLAPPGSHDEANLTESDTTRMLSQSQTNPSAPVHLVAPILESSHLSMPSYMVPRVPDPCLPLFPNTAAKDRQQRVMDMADAWDQGNNSNGVPAPRPTMLPFGWNNGGASSHGIQRVPAPHHLPTSTMASIAGHVHQRIMPIVGSTNNYGMNINRASVPTAPWPAYLTPPFSQPNSSGMEPNGVMRAPASHLSTLYMLATPRLRDQSTPASSVTGTARPLHATQAAAVNTTFDLAPPRSVSASAMVALRDLQIKKEHDGTYDDTAIPLAVALPAARATYATAIPAPAIIDSRDGGASAFYPWCPPGFKPVDRPSSSSRQAQELKGGSNEHRASAFYPWCPPGFTPVDGSSSSRQGGSNQGEQGAKPLLDLFKP